MASSLKNTHNTKKAGKSFTPAGSTNCGQKAILLHSLSRIEIFLMLQPIMAKSLTFGAMKFYIAKVVCMLILTLNVLLLLMFLTIPMTFILVFSHLILALCN